jgi:hypothetical protein
MSRGAVATFAIVGCAATVLVAGYLFFTLGGSLSASVATWHVGSADVAGTISNTTTQGCTDPEITLTLRDHNAAIVRTFTFGAGELAAGAHRTWTTHMVGLFYTDAPAEPSVTSMSADVHCADEH